MAQQSSKFEYRPAALRKRYDSFICGSWVAPVKGRFFSDASPLNGMELAEVARFGPEDVVLALDAAQGHHRGLG
jgi:aldehyde dehydrogenase